MSKLIFRYIIWQLQKSICIEDIFLILTTHYHVVFKHRFDGIYRRYITYSGGEDLFGMPITEYPEIQSIRKELNLLQKLYGLYNDVNLKVDGYFDIPWMEVNIEKINLELQEFQNRYERICSRCFLFSFF